jgi:Predicted membrane protein (DUF2079)
VSKTPTIEGEVASGPLPADDAATQAEPRPRLRVAGDLAVTGVRRAVLSPLTYLLGAATTIYLAFAYNQYKQLQVGACDLGIFYQAVHGWAYNANPYVPIKGFDHLGDHFAPIFLLLSPALWIHNSPFTLVVAQVLLLVSSRSSGCSGSSPPPSSPPPTCSASGCRAPSPSRCTRSCSARR